MRDQHDHAQCESSTPRLCLSLVLQAFVIRRQLQPHAPLESPYWKTTQNANKDRIIVIAFVSILMAIFGDL